MSKILQRGRKDPGKVPGPDSMVLGTRLHRLCSNYLTKAKQAEQSGGIPKSVPVSRGCPHKGEEAGIRPHKSEGVAERLSRSATPRAQSLVGIRACMGSANPPAGVKATGGAAVAASVLAPGRMVNVITGFATQ